MDFIGGFIFLIVYINVLRTIGSLVMKKGNFFQHLISGYLVYYVGQFFLGFIFQLCSLPLMIYHYIIGVVLVVTSIYSLYRFYRNQCKSDLLKGIIQHFKKYYLIYIYSFVLLFISLIYAQGHWLGNNMDDGYYVMKVINFVKGINVNIDPATGFEEHMYLKTKLARIVNTYELDLASYCYLFKVDVLYFIGYFYTWFNYYFILVVVVTFFEKLFPKTSVQKVLSGGMVGILFFSMYPKYFELLHISIQDAWQFNTAIWYGSSICRIPALFILMMGLLDYPKQYLKQFIYLVVCSIVLMSKGTQILPVLVYTGFIYGLVWLWNQKIKNYMKLIPIAGFALLSIVLNAIVPYTEEVGVNIVDIVKTDIKNPIMLGIIALFFYMMYVYRHNQKILVWNSILTFFFVFSYVDFLNDVLTTFSIYYFVAARETTLVFFSMVMTLSFEVAYLLLATKYGKQLLVIGNLGCCLLFSGVAFVYVGSNAIKYLQENPKLVYHTYLELSEYLNELDEQNGEDPVRVVTPAMILQHKFYTAIPSCLRYEANDLTVVSLEYRYPCHDDTNSVTAFDQQAILDFQEFNAGDVSYLDTVSSIWEQTETNTVVLTSNALDEAMQSVGYQCIHEIIDLDGTVEFYIYYK